MKGTKGTNGSCREVLEAKMEKKLPAKHNLVGLHSSDLTLPHPYTRISVFSPFKSILSGDFGRKKCWDPKSRLRRLVGISSRSVYRALEQETPPPLRRRSRSSSIVDPYLSYLVSRWNQGCHNVARLYEEIVAQGYTGTQRTLQMRLRPFRSRGARPVS